MVDGMQIDEDDFWVEWAYISDKERLWHVFIILWV